MLALCRVVLAVAILIKVEACCPDGWYRFRESCYFFETLQESWHSAVTYCEALHGHLVTLETEDEYKFVKAELMKMSRGVSAMEYWTSGNDIAVEDIWTWNHTSEPVTITDWWPGEPSHGTEDCLGLYKHDGDLHLNDAPCDYKMEFICEIENSDGDVIIG